MRRVQDLPLRGCKVLLRVDFNVPLSADGQIADDTRIREALPTIQLILNRGASLIIMSHLGRPKGKDPKLSLAVCAQALSLLLAKPVRMAPDCVGPSVQAMVQALKPGDVLMLENLRFYPAEEKPSTDPGFALALASLADFYVDDAFGAAHRPHSSITAIVPQFPGKAAAGLLMQKEIACLQAVLKAPKRPFYAMIGGAKIGSKIGLLSSLLSQVDGLFIGGAMAHIFLKLQGMEIGSSLCENECAPVAQELLENCRKKNIPLWLPQDLVIADKSSKTQIIAVGDPIPPGWQGVDIGPATVEAWKEVLSGASTVFWNGPMGIFESPPFDRGTEEMGICLSKLSATTIIGGGDSVSAVRKMGLQDKFTHLSTGGGATLEYLEYGHLPGIDALEKI